jgi:[ribosomal protein S18]-alanine N-acetyltransferase
MQDDVDQIMAVMETGFDPLHGEAWTRRQVSDVLLTGHCHYFLASTRGLPLKQGEAAAGFALSRRVLDEEELLLLAVRPEWRGQGIGRALLSRMIAHARQAGVERVFLEMRDGNPADHLYRLCGFEPVGRRRNYYRRSDGRQVDALSYSLAL